MNDMTGQSGGGDEPRITLVGINQTYWMYEGSEFLNAMLSGKGHYPRPVRCLVFEDHFELRRYFGETLSIADYWGINPDIVERLRRDDELLEISPSAE